MLYVYHDPSPLIVPISITTTNDYWPGIVAAIVGAVVAAILVWIQHSQTRRHKENRDTIMEIKDDVEKIQERQGEIGEKVARIEGRLDWRLSPPQRERSPRERDHDH